MPKDTAPTSPGRVLSSDIHRLRGIPAHLKEAMAELENSLASSDGDAREAAAAAATLAGTATANLSAALQLNNGDSPMPDAGRPANGIASQVRVFAQRLSEFVLRLQTTAEEDVAALQIERQRYMDEAEAAAREAARSRIQADESELYLKRSLEELALAKTELTEERRRVVQLQKTIVELQSCEDLHKKELAALNSDLKRADEARRALKEQKDMLTVEFAAEQSRLQKLKIALEAAESKAQRRQTLVPHELYPPGQNTSPKADCTTCARMKQELAQLKAECAALRAKAERAIREREECAITERRLQERAEDLRKIASRERCRAQKLAESHAALAEDRRYAADIISTLEGQLTKICESQGQTRYRGSTVCGTPASCRTTEDSGDTSTLTASTNSADDCFIQVASDTPRPGPQTTPPNNKHLVTNPAQLFLPHTPEKNDRSGRRSSSAQSH